MPEPADYYKIGFSALGFAYGIPSGFLPAYGLAVLGLHGAEYLNIYYKFCGESTEWYDLNFSANE